VTADGRCIKATAAVRRTANANAPARFCAAKHEPIHIDHAALSLRTTGAHEATNTTWALRAALLRRAVSLAAAAADSYAWSASTTARGKPRLQAPQR
jgi:hypothetical protein